MGDLNSRSKTLLLGAVTAIPIPAFLVCFVVPLSSTLGAVAFFTCAAFAVGVHSVMLFYYLIKMQGLKAINPDHYLIWLLVLMVAGGQLAFWYVFFWMPGASKVTIPRSP